MEKYGGASSGLHCWNYTGLNRVLSEGAGGFPIPGGVQGMPGDGIQCSGLGDKMRIVTN